MFSVRVVLFTRAARSRERRLKRERSEDTSALSGKKREDIFPLYSPLLSLVPLTSDAEKRRRTKTTKKRTVCAVYVCARVLVERFCFRSKNENVGGGEGSITSRIRSATRSVRHVFQFDEFRYTFLSLRVRGFFKRAHVTVDVELHPTITPSTRGV